MSKLAAESALLQIDQKSLMPDMSFTECAKIVVEQEQDLDNGIEIRIGGKNWRTNKEERGKTVFRLIDRKISFES